MKHWCGPLGVGRFHWTITGGALPLEVTIAGQQIDVDEHTVDIPCQQMRREYLSGPQPDDSVVDVVAKVVDSVGLSGFTSIAIGFISDAPHLSVEEVRVFAGVQDAFFDIKPWPFDYSLSDPVERVALVRYREAGTRLWQYAIPLPDPPQNWCSYWCFWPHTSDLEQNREYEYQAAWMWMEHPWDWREQLPLGEAWWRSWTSPDSMHWTESQFFRTFGVDQVVVRTEQDKVIVSWRARGGVVHTWLTSPDWPGVIWADPANPYRRPKPTLRHEASWTSAVFRGLPPDTTFTVTFKRALPDMFVQAAAQQSVVRTTSNDAALIPHVFDPRNVKVSFVPDGLQVEWNGQFPYWWVETDLYADDARLASARLSFRRIATLSILPTGPITVQRQGVHFRHSASQMQKVLYLNLRPGGISSVEARYPFVCMAWKINPVSSNPEHYLDTYFHSAGQQEQVGITPITSFWLSADGNWPYSKCVLGDAVGP